MIAPKHLSADREEKLHEVLLAYLEADAHGQAPDTRQLLDEHAEFADELADFFASRQRVESIVAPLRAAAASGSATLAIDAFRDCFGGFAPPTQHQPTHPPTLPGSAHVAPRPCRLGDFQLLHEIGRGGMGIVYEAEQVSLNRRVALKVLPFAAGLDPKQLHRFKNEAQTAALLHHPNIVPVYAVGCDAGVHYFAMHFIEGRSLADLIAESRQREGVSLNLGRYRRAGSVSSLLRPGQGADTPRSQSARSDGRVAELGLRAAQALEHAHQQGVVHRDIKPANLLLDERDELWITDFGLAMFQTGPSVTITGELVGTLRYMSPEQALAKRGLMDHRTDIYSLGATLYELLTLQPVFSGQDGQELLCQIASQEPILPRSLDRTIAIDLETILLKALAKNPSERYSSAGELADDLQRFLQHKPILARRPALLDKAAKWARRHRTFVAAGLAAFLLLIAGQAVSHCMLARAHGKVKDAYAREQLKSKEAEEQRARAEANFRQAWRVVDSFVQLSDQEMLDKPQMLEIRMKLLEAALTYYQDFIEQHDDDPSIQAELTDSRARAARILQEVTAMQDCNKLKLLTHQAVQDDLRLTASQRARVAECWKEIASYWKQHAEEARQHGVEEFRQLTLTLSRRGDRAVSEVLTPDQVRRLRQIGIQQMGTRAFNHPAVIEALGLTSVQRQIIRQHYQIEYTDPDEVRKLIPPDASMKQVGQMFVELQRHRIASVVKTLSEEQQARWKELTGKPIEGDGMFYLIGRTVSVR